MGWVGSGHTKWTNGQLCDSPGEGNAFGRVCEFVCVFAGLSYTSVGGDTAP